MKLPYSSTQLDIRDLSSGFYYLHLKISTDQGKLIQEVTNRIVVINSFNN
ncbi:MAG: hypothetical protein ACI8P3_002930 [Saprospiraceae bacterium]|jgi:hypothetical protein